MAPLSKIQYKPLQSEAEEDNNIEPKLPPQKSSFLFNPLIIHLIIILLYTAIFIAAFTYLLYNGKYSNPDNLIFSPATTAITYHPEVFQLKTNPKHMGPYFGPPSDELDLAWHELLQWQNIYISKDELNHFPGREDRAVEFPDGSGYMAQLQVFHELHCLKRIHHTMWPEYYYPNITPAETEELKFHNDHCLSTLFDSLRCHADVSLITMYWGHSQPIPLGNFSAPHKCISWNALQEWSRGRSVDVMRPGWLKHPVLGESFPAGRGSRTGVGHDN